MAEPPLMIWGAGAIGGTIGAFLARAGGDVLFVDRAVALGADVTLDPTARRIAIGGSLGGQPFATPPLPRGNELSGP